MKILVVDDHALIRDALCDLLRRVQRKIVVLESSDSRGAIKLLESHADIGLVVLDLNLPDRDGFALLAELRERFPALAIVVLSAMQDSGRVRRAIDLGALGFIPKSAQREVMLNAFRLVLGGGIYIPPEILARDEVPPADSDESHDGRPIVSPSDVGLSDRHLQVLALLMQGKTNKVICRALNLMEPTVKHHVAAILRALKAKNRTEAVIAANELRWKFPPATQGR
jgi:DNA-binding NarL/FixJ family response regulator